MVYGALLAFALGDVSAAMAQRTIDERRAAAPTGAVRIHVYAGTLRVIGWSHDSIAATGRVHEQGSDRFYIGVSEQSSKLGIWPQQGDTLPPSDIEVRVPHGSSIWIKTVTADVIVDDVSGGIDVYSVAGRIDAGGAPRELFAETMAGAITADLDTRSARVRTASGAIVLRGSIADASAQSVSGTVEVHSDDIRRGRFESVDGDVHYAGAVPRAAMLEFINHSGRVRLALPEATNADVRVSTYNGPLRGLPARLVETKRGFKGRELSFELGDGGAAIDVRTFSGAIELVRD